MWRLSSYDGIVNENIILKWINRVTGYTNINIKPSIFIYIIIMLILFLILIFLIFIYIYFNKFILNEKSWLFCCLFSFFVLAGGYYYTNSKKIPFIGLNKDGIP